jgi:hypothetical protein
MRLALALCVALIPAANAQNLTPYAPDIVMECFANGQPGDKRCPFKCGTGIPAGPSYTVDRVEIFNRAQAGRVDTRSWVVLRHYDGQTDNPKPAVIAFYIGPAITCIFDLDKRIGEAQQVRLELRITKFQF